MNSGEKQVGSLRCRLAARTDKGLVRTGNEDSFGILPDDGIVVIADGMGGHNAGEIASGIAVESVLNYLHNHIQGELNPERCLDEIEKAIEQANLSIVKSVQEKPEQHGMGTTIVVGVFRETHLSLAWVGDSRLYLLRNQKLIQLTTDHTLVQELVNQHLFPSVEAAVAAGIGENVLTRALGGEGSLLVGLGNVDLLDGDVLLFCSDGLNHMVDHRSMERVLNAPKVDLDTMAERLIQLACNAGGRDNITVVLAEMMAAG